MGFGGEKIKDNNSPLKTNHGPAPWMGLGFKILLPGYLGTPKPRN